ncbi:MAG: NAD-dependent epimerase/dehydratase family protein [Gemmatimonadaceae bacterium]
MEWTAVVRDLRSLPSPVLLLGASSLVGRFLLQRLAEGGIDTLAVSRDRQTPTRGVQWITADLTAVALPLPTLTKLAFSVSPIWLLPKALPAVHAAGARRLVAFSSTSRFTKERSPVRSERDVAHRLSVGEAETQSFCDEHDIAWTILRPTVIYAEGHDRSITRLANLIRRLGFLPLSGAGTGRRQPVHADDLAAGAISAALSPSTQNRSYNVPGGETLSYRTMAERIFEGMGRRPRIVSIPPVIWRIGLTLASPFVPGATSAMGLRMSEDLTFDGAPAERDFEWRPRGFHPHWQ